MSKLMFLNLPVDNIERTNKFFAELGFERDARISDDRTASFVVNDTCWVMCLERNRFGEFATKPVGSQEAQTTSEICIGVTDRSEVDALTDKAFQAGATTARPPMDEGFMYGKSFHDLDGYLWAVVWMDPQAFAE